MKTILVPVDFSRVTARLLDEAVSLARAVDGRIVLLHVVQPVIGLVDYAVVAFSIARVNEAAIKQAEERLAELQRSLEGRGAHVATLHTIGSPGPEIAEQATKLPADYIVVGSHGHSAVYDLMVGSTTSSILKRASCPVVIVPAAAELRRAETRAGGTTAER